jgi:hypothetical protein
MINHSTYVSFSISFSLHLTLKSRSLILLERRSSRTTSMNQNPNDVRISFPPSPHTSQETCSHDPFCRQTSRGASKRDLNRWDREYHTLVMQALPGDFPSPVDCRHIWLAVLRVALTGKGRQARQGSHWDMDGRVDGWGGRVGTGGSEPGRVGGLGDWIGFGLVREGEGGGVRETCVDSWYWIDSGFSVSFFCVRSRFFLRRSIDQNQSMQSRRNHEEL